MFTTKFLRRQNDGIEVESTHDMPGSTAFKRRKHRSIPNAITIRFSLCGKSRMKRVGNKPAPQNPNGRRQESIQRGDPPIRFIATMGQIHVRALRQRMHTRIGPPGAMHPDGLGTNALKSIFQAVLNRIAVRLALPPGKQRPVVRNDQLEPRRHLVALKDVSLGTTIARALQSIEVSLQDHLRRHLIDDLS